MFGFAGGAAGNVVRVAIKGDSDLKKTLKQGEQDVQSFSKKVSASMKANAAEIKAGFALAAGAAITKFVGVATEAAVALGESQNAVNKVFGESAETIEAFGDVAASVAGLSKREFNELSVVTGSLLKNVGFSADEAAAKTVQLTSRAADMASVFNKDVSTAMEAVNSALKGEANPIEEFGVKLNAATIEAHALEMGLAATKGELDDNAKATATLDLIMEQTAYTAGDFAQTTDDLANAQRVAASRAENAAAKFGKAWTPVFASVVGFAADALLSFQALGGSETAQMELRVSEAIGNIQEAAADGSDQMTALADGLLHVANNGDLTTGIFRTLAAQAGLMPDQFADFSEAVLGQAEAAGVDADVLAELEAAMRSAEGPTGDLAGATEDLGEEETDQAAATEAARQAIIKKRDTLRGIHDPLFRISRLTRDLAEAEQEVATAQAKGVGSQEYKDAILDRADLIADLTDTMLDLKEDGIDPTGDAARDMLEGLQVPPGIIAQLFADFDAIEANFERRTFDITFGGTNVTANDLSADERLRDRTSRHTGGRVNAPIGQEVPMTLLGGEEVTNPALASAGGGSRGSGQTIIMNNTFEISEATAGREVMRQIEEQLARMQRRRT